MSDNIIQYYSYCYLCFWEYPPGNQAALDHHMAIAHGLHVVNPGVSTEVTCEWMPCPDPEPEGQPDPEIVQLIQTLFAEMLENEREREEQKERDAEAKKEKQKEMT